MEKDEDVSYKEDEDDEEEEDGDEEEEFTTPFRNNDGVSAKPNRNSITVSKKTQKKVKNVKKSGKERESFVINKDAKIFANMAFDMF